MRHNGLLLLFAALLACGQADAQRYSMFPGTGGLIDPYFVETRDTVSTGFGPRILTRALLQDKKGQYWFATWKGIVCYDGKAFTNYTLKQGLLHAHVFSLFEDQAGRLWFGTAAGLYRYDGKSFRLFTTKDGLVNNNVTCMWEDKAGNTWFGTDSGASRYDGKSFTNFTDQNGFNCKFINAGLQDKTGTLWFGASNGLTCYDGKTFTTFKNSEGQDFDRVASLLEDKDGNIWIGSGKGLWKYDGHSLTEPVKANLVMYMCQDKAGDLWFAFNRFPADRNFSLYRYNGKVLTNIKTMEDADHSWQIFGIIEDSAGSIWFGTMNGPCRYDGKSFAYFVK